MMANIRKIDFNLVAKGYTLILLLIVSSMFFIDYTQEPLKRIAGVLLGVGVGVVTYYAYKLTILWIKGDRRNKHINFRELENFFRIRKEFYEIASNSFILLLIIGVGFSNLDGLSEALLLSNLISLIFLASALIGHDSYEAKIDLIKAIEDKVVKNEMY